MFERFGDWEKVQRKLGDNLGARLALELQKATVKSALLLVREIKRGIKSQAPGGKTFVKLAESTIRRKGSSKALIDTGFLVNAITQRIMEDKAFVGLLRGTVNPKGGNMVNIGAVLEFGATINHPNGAVIVIPPRPFLHPVMAQYRKTIAENYREAIKKVMGT